jgi:hypothetical protein
MEFFAMRKAFEKEATKANLNLRYASHKGEYFIILTQAWWEMWQVSWKLAREYEPAAPAKPTIVPRTLRSAPRR